MLTVTGPLRVLPGSHLDYALIPKEDEHKPDPREVLLNLRAGDMVFTHHELLHSGKWNISREYCHFLSVYVYRIGLPHRHFTFGIRERLRSSRQERTVSRRQKSDFLSVRDQGSTHGSLSM